MFYKTKLLLLQVFFISCSNNLSELNQEKINKIDTIDTKSTKYQILEPVEIDSIVFLLRDSTKNELTADKWYKNDLFMRGVGCFDFSNDTMFVCDNWYTTLLKININTKQIINKKRIRKSKYEYFEDVLIWNNKLLVFTDFTKNVFLYDINSLTLNDSIDIGKGEKKIWKFNDDTLEILYGFQESIGEDFSRHKSPRISISADLKTKRDTCFFKSNNDELLGGKSYEINKTHDSVFLIYNTKKYHVYNYDNSENSPFMSYNFHDNQIIVCKVNKSDILFIRYKY